LSSPKLIENYKVLEAGDSISHEDFASLKSSVDAVLSNGNDLFIEDAGIGTHWVSRVGTRIISQNAATALAFRKLMVPVPPRPADHRNRFDGWQNDDRHRSTHAVWNSTTNAFDKMDRPVASKGARPVVAFIAGQNDKIAVQFVDREGRIVGGNVVAGEQAPVRGIIEAITLAASVVVNNNPNIGNTLSIPTATSFSLGKDSTHSGLLVGAPDDVVEAVSQKHTLYSPYGIIVNDQGMSAMWNGYIGNKSSAEPASDNNNNQWHARVPPVIVGNHGTVVHEPHNVAHTAQHILFYEKGGKKTEITTDDVVKRVAALTEASKADYIRSLLQDMKGYVVGSAEDVLSL